MSVEVPTPATTTTTTPRAQWWWLLFLGFVLLQPAFDPDSSWVDWALAAGIIVVYVPIYLYEQCRPGGVRERAVVLTLLLGVVTTQFNAGASGLFIFAAAFAGAVGPPERARRWLSGCFVLLALLAVVSPVPFPYRLLSFGPPLALVWFVGMATMAEAERERESARLRVENARIEHLATVGERERIARDLHDVLGHTLTAVVVRAQLVQRLTATDPARARQEAAGIEHAARDALAAVRDTVSGYRTSSLPAELEQARAALAAVGVSLEVEGAALDVSPTVETELAMALREAITNVVRHAGATTCRVRIVREGTELRLEVADDGRGGGVDGNGLRGMRERIAALGGRVERIAEAGTVVTVAVPVQVAG
jgi:two-component system sensor histidine kinase DesK